jgi:hypothetical protein
MVAIMVPSEKAATAFAATWLQIDAMRVEGFHVRRRRAIGKQLLVRMLLRGFAGVEKPRRLGIGINELEAGAGLHSTCD